MRSQKWQEIVPGVVKMDMEGDVEGSIDLSAIYQHEKNSLDATMIPIHRIAVILMCCMVMRVIFKIWF